MSTVHQSKVGTFHPAPHQGSFVEAWTINDTRDTIDDGLLVCDECSTCECEPCPHETAPLFGAKHGASPSACERCDNSGRECIGLSFAFVCLDGGDSLCGDCAEKAGIQIVPCDCE